MRSRNIKPSFFCNDELAECSIMTRLFFIGIWCCADRNGRLEHRPKKLKAQIFPYDDCDAVKMIESLSRIKIKEFINSVAMVMQDLSDFGKDDIDEVTIKEFSSILDFIYEYYHINPVIDTRQQKTMKVQ